MRFFSFSVTACLSADRSSSSEPVCPGKKKALESKHTFSTRSFVFFHSSYVFMSKQARSQGPDVVALSVLDHSFHLLQPGSNRRDRFSSDVSLTGGVAHQKC